MSTFRIDPHGRGVQTAGPPPPIRHDHPIKADGRRLVGVEQLDERRVTEVETTDHGVLAVGLTPDGSPFAVGNLCRHQFAKLGRGRVTEDGCLEYPWHRATYDVNDGTMTSGPKGRIFGFKPYSWAFKTVGNFAPLHTLAVEVRDGGIWLID